MTFNIGETVICSITVKDSTGALANPATSMSIQITGYQGTVIQAYAAMTNDSTGAYHYDFDTASKQATDYIVYYKAVDGTRTSIATDTFKLV